MKNEHDIALELMDILNKEFGTNFYHSATIFDADIIERENFYNVIVLILHLKAKEDCCEFIDRIFKYKNKNMSEIKEYERIFEEFKSYIQ